MKTMVSPSLLAADYTCLGKEIDMINNSNADWLHCDIMDGVFVPNISFGFSVLDPIGKICKKPLDVHLMIVNPDNYIDQCKEAGAQWITVHYEACTHLHRTLQQIKSKGMKAGVALNPATPVNVLEDILHDCDMVLIMSVNPGFGGQKFIEHSLEKIKRLKKMINERGCNTLIQVDGGVNLQTGQELIDAGADVLVAGSFVFKAPSPEEAINGLKSLKAN